MAVRTATVVAAALVATACATTQLRLPDGPSRPVAQGEAEAAFEQATASCRTVRTFTAEIGLSGRFGTERLRGRVLAGFDRATASVRLEAPAPFGAPAFILAAREDRATLLLPRSDQVLDGAPVADVVEALTGLRRGAKDLLALLNGCVVDDTRAGGGQGRRYGADFLAVSLAEGAEVFLRSERQRWQVALASTSDRAAGAPWLLAYAGFSSPFPGEVRLTRPSGPGGGASDVRFTLSQIEANVPIAAEAFTVKVPADAVRISIEDLRQIGPLADRGGDSRSR